MSNLSIGAKLMVMSIVSILLVTAIILSQRLGNVSIDASNGAANQLQRIQREVLGAKSEVYGMQLAVQDIRLARTSDDMTKAMEFLAERQKAFHQFIDPLVKLDDVGAVSQRAKRLGVMADEFANRAITELVSIKSEAVDLDTNWTKELAQRIAEFNQQTDELARTRTLPLAMQMTKMSDDIVTVSTGLVDEKIAFSAETMKMTENIGLLIGAAAVLLLIGAAMLGRRSIARPLVALIKPINELAGGNFSVKVDKRDGPQG